MNGFRAMQGAKSREQQRYFEISATPQSTKAAIKTVFRINQRLLKPLSASNCESSILAVSKQLARDVFGVVVIPFSLFGYDKKRYSRW